MAKIKMVSNDWEKVKIKPYKFQSPKPQVDWIYRLLEWE